MVVLSLALIALIFPVIKPANHENIQNVFANKRYRALSIAHNPTDLCTTTLMMITFPNCLQRFDIDVYVHAANEGDAKRKRIEEDKMQISWIYIQVCIKFEIMSLITFDE